MVKVLFEVWYMGNLAVLIPDRCPALYCSLILLQSERLMAVMEIAKHTDQNVRYVHEIIPSR